jgi:hypothetical protein
MVARSAFRNAAKSARMRDAFGCSADGMRAV